MALVTLTNVVVLDNPAPFLAPLRFEIEFECLQALPEDLDWKVVYVGSAEDEKRDQVLEEVGVGPIHIGINKFILEADAPDPNKIPIEDMKGVTVLLLQCSYRGREFIRVGYYVNNEMPGDTINTSTSINADDIKADTSSTGNGSHNESAGAMMLNELQKQSDQHQTMLSDSSSIDQGIPADPNVLIRSVLADKPRVTRFTIPWTADQETDMNDTPMQSQQQQQHAAGMINSSASSSGLITSNNDDMIEDDDIGVHLDEIGITDDDNSSDEDNSSNDESGSNDREINLEDSCDDMDDNDDDVDMN